MYASPGRIQTSHHTSNNQSAIPVETYDNRAILEELARRNKQEESVHSSSNNCTDCSTDCSINDNENKNDFSPTEQCPCKNSQKKSLSGNKSGIFGSFGSDDALILLIILLILTDGDTSFDILVPILLGLLLLT